MSENEFELEAVTAIAVATVGPPGQRQFFLQAQDQNRLVTLACEKAHIQLLVVHIHQLLAAQGLDPAVGDSQPALQPPGSPLWTVAELGLGYHEAREKFVIVAREAGAEEPATIRFWLDLAQVRGLARQAEEQLSSGRPLCRRCGLPLDPAGHPCPAANGARPIF